MKKRISIPVIIAASGIIAWFEWNEISNKLSYFADACMLSVEGRFLYPRRFLFHRGEILDGMNSAYVEGVFLANSMSQLESFKAVCTEKGIEVVDQGVSGAADIPQAATTLASQVDCINNFTDNNVVNNLSIVLEKANAANIPVYGSEIEQVKNGCLASISIDYIALGKKTAEMGVEVLNGTDPKTMAVGTISDGTPVINSEVMEKFGFTVPEKYADAEMVTTNSEADAA